MLHIIGQMRNMFMASIVGYLDNPDRNNNTRLDAGDFSGLSPEQQKELILALGGLGKAWYKAYQADKQAYIDFTNATLVSNGQAEKIKGRHVREYNKIAEAIAADRGQVLKPRKDLKAETAPLAGTQFLADAYAGKIAEGKESTAGLSYRGEFRWTGNVLSVGNKSRADEIYNMQVALVKAGFGSIVGNPDGKWGNGTKQAIQRLMNNREYDGSFMNQAVFDALYKKAEGVRKVPESVSSKDYSANPRKSTERSSHPTLESPKGKSKDEIKAIQQQLVDAGVLPATYINKNGKTVSSVDGLWGKGSQSALDTYNMEKSIASLDGKIVDVEIDSKIKNIRNILNRSITVENIKDSEWESLASQITKMSKTGSFTPAVWDQFIAKIQNDPKFAPVIREIEKSGFLGLNKINDMDKYIILSHVGENMMGGNRILQAIQTGNTKEVINIDQKRGDKLLSTLSGASGISLPSLQSARAKFYAQTSQKYERGNYFNGGEVFSARERPETGSFAQGYISHEVVKMANGSDYLPMGKSSLLVNKLSQTYLQLLADKTGVSADKIQQALINGETITGSKGEVTFDYEIGYFKSADCFNDALGVIPHITITSTTPGGGGGSSSRFQHDTRPGGRGAGGTGTGTETF